MPVCLVIGLVVAAGFYVEMGIIILLFSSMCLFILTFYSFGAVVCHVKRGLFLTFFSLIILISFAFVSVVLYSFSPISYMVVSGGSHWFSFWCSPACIGACIGTMASVVCIVVHAL